MHFQIALVSEHVTVLVEFRSVSSEGRPIYDEKEDRIALKTITTIPTRAHHEMRYPNVT